MSGLYTGILAVTLWNICESGAYLLQHQAETNGTVINKCRPIRRAMVLLVILLHALITISFAATWSFTRSAFIGNGKVFWAVYQKLSSTGQALSLEVGIPASISTVLADLYMVCATLLGIIRSSSPLFRL